MHMYFSLESISFLASKGKKSNFFFDDILPIDKYEMGCHESVAVSGCLQLPEPFILG